MIPEEEIFCLIGSFLTNLKKYDWKIINNDLIIFDKAILRIAKKLSKIWKVEMIYESIIYKNFIKKQKTLDL